MAKRNATVDDAADEGSAGGFEAMAKKTLSETPEAKLVPTGNWLLKGKSAKMYPSTENPNEGVVRFYVTPIEAQEDVDPDLAASDAWKGELMSYDIFIKKASDWRQVGAFGEKLGLEGSYVEIVEQFGKTKPSFYATVGSRTWTDKGTGQPKSANTVRNPTPAE